jgi:P-type Ca2+ transporter type 2C
MKPFDKNSTQPWHTLSVEDVIARLGSNLHGLADSEATRRLSKYGLNELKAAAPVSRWAILAAQFKNVLIIILLMGAALSAFLGHGTEAVAISVMVLLAVLLGFVQEYRAERALEALSRMAAPNASILRDGRELVIPASKLVPGDLVLLRTGDRVPADLRLFETVNLQCDEAALTGESVPVEKQTARLEDPNLSVGDRSNLAYAGTMITYGRGRGMAVVTGMGTEFGKVAQMLQSVEVGRTPLQENLDKVGKSLAMISLAVVAVIVALGVLRGQPFLEMLIFGIALAVAAVPEALPAVVTISLAIGVQHMARRNALVRRLPAVETLGSTSVICTDKTGTLTRGEMTVRNIFLDGRMVEVSGAGYEPSGRFTSEGSAAEPSDGLRLLLQAGALSSDAQLIEDVSARRWKIIGDPTEGALVVAAAKAGLDKTALESEYPRVHEIPFTSESKRMTTLHASSKGQVAYSKGAPEVILESSTQELTASGLIALDGTRINAILTMAQHMADQALRVLAVAYKPDAVKEDAEQETIFLGLLGMIDPPRPEAKDAVGVCTKAGIKTVMITGDHPLTARAIARELGILKHGRVVTGVELEAMNDCDFEREVESIEVYARVSPKDKLRVVTALQKKDYIVAMTGDGVNDAPALRKADIGVAMGITGTDVTKEAGVMTLLDDNFASIVGAVEEGRKIFGNIKKYLMFLLSSNIGEIVLMAAASFIGLPLPLTAVQILFVNFVTDGLPALALSVDPPEEDLMSRPPRNPRTGIFTRPVVILIMVGGLWSAIVNMGVFTWALTSGMPLIKAMSMTFVSLILIQFFKAYNFRSDRHSVLNRTFSNKWLNAAILGEIVLLAAVIEVPFLEEIFKTVPLSLTEWTILLGAAFTVSPVLEITKWIIRRKYNGNGDEKQISE